MSGRFYYQEIFLNTSSARCRSKRMRRFIWRSNSSINLIIGFAAYTKAILLNRYYKNKNCKNKLGIVAIAKDEGEYLREWVSFHKAIGVDIIYLYDNDSTDNMLDTVQDYIEEGFIKIETIHGRVKQLDAYNDAIRKYSAECEYMAFIDCDEYLVPTEISETINVKGYLDDLFHSSVIAGGVGINWRLFGSSGYTAKPDGLCIDNFIWRSETSFKENRHIKTICKPKCVKEYRHPHFPIYKFGWCNINQSGVPIPGWCTDQNAEDYLQLNHYYTKSKEQWIKRRSLGRADTGGMRSIDEFYANDKNDIKDTSAAKYSALVHNLMERNTH